MSSQAADDANRTTAATSYAGSPVLTAADDQEADHESGVGWPQTEQQVYRVTPQLPWRRDLDVEDELGDHNREHRITERLASLGPTLSTRSE